MVVFYTILRSTLLIFVSLGVVLAGSAFAKSPEVKVTDDLVKVGKQAQKRQLPVLVMFSSSHCGYCVVLENEILKPMLISGDYTDKVIIRKIIIDDPGFVKDFNGKDLNVDDITTRYDISVTPTMLFLDSNGRELAKRIVGITTIDYFGGDVDNAIDKSIKMLRQRQSRISMKTR